jgi:hypothetical protein
MTANKTKSDTKRLILFLFIAVEILLYFLTYYRIISYPYEVIGSVAVIILILGLYFPVRKSRKQP